MTHYSPPDWSSTGRNVFALSLEVIKSGVTVDRLPLDQPDGRSYVVVGRMETVCDVALAHPSISRVHAVLQFDEQGALFLYDTRSTHGCYVNKRRVPAEDFVRLHIGDVLVFGESTRLYVVCGPAELLPPEYESANLTKLRENLDERRSVQDDRKQLEERGVSWGFGEDAEDGEEGESDEEMDAAKTREVLPDYLCNLKEDDQPYTSSVGPSQIHEKDQRLYQQLQTRIRKMENLKLERSRILAKQNQLNGLSEGQQNTLDRNEQRIDALMKEIDNLEGRIHAKNDQRTQSGSAAGTAAGKKLNVNEELYGYSSDEDDFYDRTKTNQQKITARKHKVTCSVVTLGVPTAAPQTRTTKSTVLTEASIKANVKKLEAELAKVQDELAAKIGHDIRGDSETQMGTDTLDSFMAATTTQLQESKVDALTRRKEEMEVELRRQRQLLAVATPALAAIPISEPYAGTGTDVVKTSPLALVSAKKPSAQDVANVQDVAPKDTSAAAFVQDVALKDTSAAANVQDAAQKDTSAAANVQDAAPKDTPAAAEMQSLATAISSAQTLASPRPEETADETDVKPVAPKRRRIVGPALVSSLQPNPPVSNGQPGNDPSVLEGGDQVWVPPTNQTGDGRTKLNDKYGY
uniref:FHA domain-containing protein n=1 Tax=Peronospora matthiolae TaxID=2874970 RepID=A0AAV1VAY1_9STRA